MAGLVADSGPAAIKTFKDHLNSLLARTITQTPLVSLEVGSRATIEFRENGLARAVEIGSSGFFLFINQSVKFTKEAKRRYRLKTLTYSYRIADGPAREDWLFRWEYVSHETEQGKSLHPRHHCHLPFDHRCLTTKTHIPTGWVLLEEVIRFLIHELGVDSLSEDWDDILKKSEEQFRIWTGRDT
jgi:hypothetical protein